MMITDGFFTHEVRGARNAIIWQTDEDGDKRSLEILFYRRGPGFHRFLFVSDDSLLAKILGCGIDASKGPFAETVYDAARADADRQRGESEMAEQEEKTPDTPDRSPLSGTLTPVMAERLAGFYLLELARLCNNQSAYDEVVRKMFPRAIDLRGTFTPRGSQSRAA